MNKVDFSKVEITGGFWKGKQDLVRETTVWAVYDRFKETGRFDAIKCIKDSAIKPHIYWDSDVAKWIEGVAYLLEKKEAPELEKIVDGLIADIEKNQEECGYFNSYYLVLDYDERFTKRDCHELYCAGHFIEAAVAYYNATGKRALLDIMIKYVSYIEKRFKIDKDTGFKTPGHEEIELALVKLYEVTGDASHLELSKFFVDERRCETLGVDWSYEAYNQSHKLVREQETAEGHAVRATYLYCAMADLALKTGDEGLKNACVKIFDDIVNHKMYITGGIGSSQAGEAFTVSYDLPNLLAYTESCAAIGLIFFAQRMLLLTNDAKYSNVIERALYNGFLSSISLDGKSFFYCNPLEILPTVKNRDVSVSYKAIYLPDYQRLEVFDCSCCPPNIVRFIPSIGNLLYTYDENAIYVHQFMESVARLEIDGECVEITQKTNYPMDGRIEITVKGTSRKIYVRIPEFADPAPYKMDKGYAVMEPNSQIILDLDMTPRFIEANPNVLDDAGKCALMKGPVVYCLESVDNGKNLRDIVIDTEGKITEGYDKDLGVTTLNAEAYRRSYAENTLYRPLKKVYDRVKIKLIPYYAFANRELCEMQVWTQYK